MIEVQAGALAAALKLADKVVETKSTVPVLANVRLSASKESGLHVCATDLDLWFDHSLPSTGKAKAIKPFETTVSAHRLANIAGSVDKESTLILSATDRQLTVKGMSDGSSGVEWSLPVLPVDDFPMPFSVEWTADFTMATFDLQAMMDSICFAASTDAARYYLNGLFLHAHADGLLTGVTTDGHRLGRWRCDAPDGALGIPDMILPTKALKVLDGLIDKSEEVHVRAVQSRCEITVGGEGPNAGAVLTFKTVDGTFPDYMRVIPAHNDRLLVIEAKALAAAVKRVLLVASEKGRAVTLRLAGEFCTVALVSPEGGQGLETLPCAWSGPDVTYGFNGVFLCQMLDQFDGKVNAELADEAAPSRWTAGDGARADFVLMPMRV